MKCIKIATLKYWKLSIIVKFFCFFIFLFVLNFMWIIFSLIRNPRKIPVFFQKSPCNRGFSGPETGLFLDKRSPRSGVQNWGRSGPDLGSWKMRVGFSKHLLLTLILNCSFNLFRLGFSKHPFANPNPSFGFKLKTLSTSMSLSLNSKFDRHFLSLIKTKLKTLK